MNRLTILLLIVIATGCGKPNPEAALHRAASLGSEKKVKKLLESGSDVNKSVDGRTPLQAATKSHKPNTMRLLLENGADPMVKDDKGRDLWELNWAGDRFIGGREAQTMAVLIEHGFEDKITLIEAAKQADSVQLMAALVKVGQDVNQVDDFGWTALHHAAEQGHGDSCQALLQAGADFNAETTKQYGKQQQRGESYTWRFKYEAGSRPLDVASFKSKGRAGDSAHKIIKDWGGTSNEKVKNRRR